VNETPFLSAIFLTALHVLIQFALVARALLRPHRDPASRIAWVVVIVSLPVLGILSYLLFGEVNIGRRRVQRMRAVLARMPALPDAADTDAGKLRPSVPERHAHLFRVGHSISGFEPVGGNSACLLADSNAVIDAMVADIDAAREHVHLLFYIWLPDNNGRKIVEALKRATARGIACRAMADDLGSRLMIQSEHWRTMGAAGIRLARALPIGNPLRRALTGRIDLRNHRKILVVDTAVTYCGSQNCADPAFLPKARFAPWVDVMMRFEGPVVWQNQHLFASDWMGNGGDDISALLHQVPSVCDGGFVAQVVATGPTYRAAAMPELFASLIYAAQHELFITTPYYVPTQALQAAICAAANRGVEVTLILPARNDDFAVGAASRSHYESFLEAGVRVYEFLPGLLHAKTLTLDGEVTLIGSANMDRRSFDLNYENNILLADPAATAAMRARQEEFLAQSRPVTREEVAAWGIGRRMANNALAIMGPVL